MPNHTTTEIILKGKPEILAGFVKKYMVWEGSDAFLDFDKVIPRPKTPEECEPEFVIMDAEDAKSRCLQYESEEDWFDWYHWDIKNWGTKWNSYDGTCPTPEEILEDKMEEVRIWLYTAWSPAMPVYEKLQKLHDDIVMDVYYADEGGFFVGHLHYNGRDEWYSGDFNQPDAKAICDELGQEYLYEPFEDEDECDAKEVS